MALTGFFCLIFLFFPEKRLMGQRMTAHLWENRVLILFAEQESGSIPAEQLEIFNQHQEGMKERDLLVYQIYSTSGKGPDGKTLSPEQVKEWRKRWKVDSNDFVLILIGKDGGTKLRKKALTPIDQIFDLIDSMPMRQAEMKRGN